MSTVAKIPPQPAVAAGFASWPRFQSLPTDAITLIVTAGRQRQYPPGSVLAHQRDPHDGLHIVVTGAVQIERWHSALVSPVVLGSFGPGEVVSNRVSLPDGSRLSASAVAADATTTIELDGEAVTLLVQRCPPLADILVCRIADVPGDGGSDPTAAGGAARPADGATST